MIRFRPHRGMLSESLKETVVFESKTALFNYIETTMASIIKHFEERKQSDERISISEDAIYDSRCDWMTRNVMVYGNCVGQCEIVNEEDASCLI